MGDPWLSLLSSLPFIRQARVAETERDQGWDGFLTIETPSGTFRVAYDEKRGIVGHAAVAQVAGRPVPSGSDGRLLVAGYVSPGVAAVLQEAGVAYLDLAGNCHFALGDRFFAHIEGRPAPAPRRAAGLRGSATRVLGACLDDPLLLSRPLRAVAFGCGVSTSAVTAIRRRLEAEEALVRGPRGWRLLSRSRYLDTWLAGYRELLRPRLVIGRYALPHGSVEALARLLEQALAPSDWAWGGSQASYRLFHTGWAGDLVVHLRRLHREGATRLPLREDPEGAVEVMALPWVSAGESEHGCVRALLVLAELAHRHDPRAVETASTVRENILWHWKVEDGA
jgi:hypothetical protein